MTRWMNSPRTGTGVTDAAGRVDNDATWRGMPRWAWPRRAGAQVLGLSGMMDGQVGFGPPGCGGVHRWCSPMPRHHLRALWAFRESGGGSSMGPGDFWIPPARVAEARTARASRGHLRSWSAGWPHLDILAAVAALTPVPVAAPDFEVLPDCRHRWAGLDRQDRVVMESLLGIRRADAQMS